MAAPDMPSAITTVEGKDINKNKLLARIETEKELLTRTGHSENVSNVVLNVVVVNGSHFFLFSTSYGGTRRSLGLGTKKNKTRLCRRGKLYLFFLMSVATKEKIPW